MLHFAILQFLEPLSNCFFLPLQARPSAPLCTNLTGEPCYGVTSVVDPSFNVSFG